MSLIMRDTLIAKAHCSTMRALGLIVGTMSPTVDRGLRETVSKRNATGVFQILFIETVCAPPLRATEMAVT